MKLSKVFGIVACVLLAGTTAANELSDEEQRMADWIDAHAEECIRDLLLANPADFAYEDITGLRWIEIDFPEDIIRARTMVLPHMQQLDLTRSPSTAKQPGPPPRPANARNCAAC